LSEELHQFAVKYNFSYKRPQYFKNCIVIRWKTSSKPYKLTRLVYNRIEEYVRLAHDLTDKHNLWDANDSFCDEELRLFRIGIYVGNGTIKYWAIPDDFKETQDYVLSKLPKWAKVVKK
jgi:hypothetical protein